MPTEPQIVNVLGEQVSMEKTQFSPAEKFLVSFDEKYKYPGMTPSEEIILKRLFTTLFSGSSAFLPGKTKPFPPCSDKEKELFLQSFLYRFSLLRNELLAERKSTSDSLRLRQLLDHIERVKEYIDFLETTTQCKELDEDLLAESIGDLTDDQILELLKQFVFFMLQGTHPLEDFKGRDPNPKGFVARLSRKPMDQFDDFMKQYRGKKYPIPLPVDKVLQATQLDLQAMKGQLQQGVQAKVKEIYELIANSIPEDDPFWQNLDKTNLNAVIDKLLELVQQLKADLADCNQQSERDQSILVNLQEEVERLNGVIDSLEEKLQLMEGNLASVEQRSEEDVGNQEEYEEFMDDARLRIKALQQRIQELENQKRELQERMEKAAADAEANLAKQGEKEQQLKQLEESQAEITTLKERITSLQEQLAQAQAKVKECEGYQSKIAALEKQVEERNSALTVLRQHAGELTSEIDKHLQEKQKYESEKAVLVETIETLKSEVESLKQFLESLSQDKSIVINLLNNIQRTRADIVDANDPILGKMVALSNNLKQNNSLDLNLGDKVAEILKEVQEELSQKEVELLNLQIQIDRVQGEIEATKKQMEESNLLLQQVRNGRVGLDGKGIKFETDKEMLEAAFKAIEAEKELKRTKEELEQTVETLNKENQTLQGFMSALETRMKGELEAVQSELDETKENYQREQEESGLLRKDLSVKSSEIESLREKIQSKEAEAKEAQERLAKEREESIQRLADLQEKNLRDCEDRLRVLREEEEKRRVELIGAQGAQKGTLEAKIQELLKRITDTEAERDGFKGELEVERGKIERVEGQLEKMRAESEGKIAELTQQLKEAEESGRASAGEAVRLQGTITDLLKETEELKTQIISNTTERSKLFDLIATISAWITSGGKLPIPTVDEEVNNKYGLNRILNAFLGVLPKEEERADTSDSLTSAMSRCYLVFFMSFVFARHFPLQTSTRTNSDASYQSEITAFFKDVLTEVYRRLDAGIPGKLEAVGSAGIPIQLKAKYVMNLFLVLVKQMELVHESGKKGADFLKFDLLDQDQLATLHTVHTILLDKLKLKGKDFLQRLHNYVKRRTGNTDDDLQNLYLRFYHETKSDREYPVIMYISPDAKEIPKFTFGTEVDFSQYLSSPVKKEGTKLTERALAVNPLFSFDIVFYLFLFVSKDYLSSIEGELDKARCPLPQILKSR